MLENKIEKDIDDSTHDTKKKKKNVPEKSIWKRYCPNPDNNSLCKLEISYSCKKSLQNSIKKNCVCKSCSQIGIKNHTFGKPQSREKSQRHSIRMTKSGNPMYGKHHSSKTKLKISIANTGRVYSNDRNNKISKSHQIYDKITQLSSKRQRVKFYDWLKLNRPNGFEKYIGLSLNEFKTWISIQFKDGMSWNNHGKYT